MTCDSGRLQTYIDGELPAEERVQVIAHLRTCHACQNQLADLLQKAKSVDLTMAELDPTPPERASASQALSVFYADTLPRSSTLWHAVTRRVDEMRNVFSPQRTGPRLATVAITTLILLTLLFTFTPAREAIAQFLGVFRVNKFVAIPIAEIQEDQQQALEEFLESGMLGEPEYLREPGEPQFVKDAAAAAELAGYPVNRPMTRPEGSQLSEMSVVQGPHLRLTVDRNAMEMLLMVIGAEEVELPVVDQISAEVDMPPAVYQAYEVDNPYGNRDAKFSVLQAPSPAVDIPPGIDPVIMGELYLRAAGLPPEEARQLAQTIDWTSTFVLPIPTDSNSYQELTVSGNDALLIRGKPDEQGFRQRTLLWEQDGYIYAIEGKNISDSAIMAIAESLQ